MFFKFLNYRQANKVQMLDKSYGRETTNNTMSTISPPPPYGALFNRHRFMTGSDLFYGQDENQFGQDRASKESSLKTRKVVNGRDYLVVTEKGTSRLIPMRVPSAALFQYSYTN